MTRKSPATLMFMGSLVILAFSAILFVSGLVLHAKSASSSPSAGQSFLDAIEEDCRREKEKENREIPMAWGKPFTISDERSKFLVTMKDAWYSDEKPDNGKRKFYVVYSYKNLGPREGCFYFSGSWQGDRSEIITSEGHIYEKAYSDVPDYYFGDSHWKKNMNEKIGGTGETAMVFWIPSDAIPTELAAKKKGVGVLKFKLPKRSFETKSRYEFDSRSRKFEIVSSRPY